MISVNEFFETAPYFLMFNSDDVLFILNHLLWLWVIK